MNLASPDSSSEAMTVLHGRTGGRCQTRQEDHRYAAFSSILIKAGRRAAAAAVSGQL
jgi:hypothetical protein